MPLVWSEEDVRTKVVYTWLREHGFAADEIQLEFGFRIRAGRQLFPYSTSNAKPRTAAEPSQAAQVSHVSSLSPSAVLHEVSPRLPTIPDASRRFMHACRKDTTLLACITGGVLTIQKPNQGNLNSRAFFFRAPLRRLRKHVERSPLATGTLIHSVSLMRCPAWSIEAVK